MIFWLILVFTMMGKRISAKSLSKLPSHFKEHQLKKGTCSLKRKMLFLLQCTINLAPIVFSHKSFVHSQLWAPSALTKNDIPLTSLTLCPGLLWFLQAQSKFPTSKSRNSLKAETINIVLFLGLKSGVGVFQTWGGEGGK